MANLTAVMGLVSDRRADQSDHVRAVVIDAPASLERLFDKAHHRFRALGERPLTSAGVTSARSSLDGGVVPFVDITSRILRTLWMCAKVVAMLRRFEHGGGSRQIFGSSRLSST